MKALIVRELRALKGPALAVGALMALLWIALARAVLGADASVELTGERLFLILVAWGVLLPIAAMGLGARLIARERAHREVEFSASWPVSRARAWAAKLAVGLSALAVLIGLAWLAVVASSSLLQRAEDAGALTLGGPLAPPALVVVAIAVALFALGLLMSTIRPSPFDALGSGLLAALVLLIGLGIVYADIVPQRWGPQIGLWPMDVAGSASAYAAFAIMFAVACAAASFLGCARTLPLQFGRRSWLTLGVGAGLTLVAVVLLPLGLWRFGEPTAADIRAITWAQTSPDGEWVWFADGVGNSPVPERSRLWIVRTDGTGLRCIARAPVQGWGEWNAQRWLPFIWGPRPEQTFDPDVREWVWAWDMERMVARVVPTLPGSRGRTGLQVSPDGRYLLAEAIFALGDDIRLREAQLPSGASFAGWGNGCAYFEDDRALWALGLPGGGLTRVADAPGEGQWGARVSPDGRWIAWSRSGIVEAAFGMVLTDMRGEVRGRFPAVRIAEREPWSPDGRFLWACDSLRFLVVGLGEEPTIAEVDAPEGWHMFGPTVRWSADGRTCAVWYARGFGAPPHVAWFVANADGSGLRKIAEPPGETPPWPWSMVGWTAAGRVAVIEDARRIVAIDPDTSEREVIFESRWAPPPVEEIEPASGGG